MTPPSETQRQIDRIREGEGLAPSEALKTMLDAGNAFLALPAVEEAIEARKHFNIGELARLIVDTKGSSNHLLVRTLNAIRADRWAMIKVYRGGVAMQTLEPDVLSLLRKVAHSEGEPVRWEILKAIHDVGGPECIPVLEYLLEDWVNTHDRKRSLVAALGQPPVGEAPSAAHVASAVLGSFTSTIESARLAIAAIRARDASDQASSGSSDSTVAVRGANTLGEWERLVQRELAALGRSMRANNPRETLTQIRRCSEAAVSVYYLRRKLGSVEDKKKTLGEMLKQVKSSLEAEADWIFRQFEALNCLTRITAHSSHAGFDDITVDDVKAIKCLHDNVIRWYDGLSVSDRRRESL